MQNILYNVNLSLICVEDTKGQTEIKCKNKADT